MFNTKIKMATSIAAGLLMAGAAHAQEEFNYGTVSMKGDAGIILMSTQDQFDEANGLDIKPLPLKGDSLLLKALIAGEIDAYVGNPGGPLIAASKGADIEILACPWPGLTYALYTKPEIENVAGLKGGSIGVSSPGSLPDLFARGVLRSAGLSQDDVSIVVAGSGSERVAAVVAGIITAAPSSSEFQARAPDLGLKMLVHARDVVPEYVRLCIMANGAAVEADPEKYERFIAAQIEGFTFALENREETIALSKELANLPENDKTAAFAIDEAIEYSVVDLEMNVDVGKLRWLRDLLADNDRLSADFDPADIINTAVLDAAKLRVAAQ